MYSKNKNTNTGGYSDLTPPPGYYGSRLFSRRERSDGRDENFVVHTRPIYRGRAGGNREGNPDTNTRRLKYGARSKEVEAPREELYETAPIIEEEPVPFFSGPEEFFDAEEDPFFPVEEPYDAPKSASEEKPQESTPPKSKAAGLTLPQPLAGLLNGLEREDLLLIGLIILLSGEQNMGTGDILLLLALLLLTK